MFTYQPLVCGVTDMFDKEIRNPRALYVKDAGMFPRWAKAKRRVSKRKSREASKALVRLATDYQAERPGR